MRKRLHLVALIGCGLLLVIAAGLYGLHRGLQHEPEFYREAIGTDTSRQRQASEEMLERTAALYSDVREEDQWRALFTAEQINGWLAVDLVQNHPDVLPRSLRDPRVAIRTDRMTVACRLQRRGLTGVVTLTVEPYIQEPNLLALRIRKARAGLVPMPLAEILDRISEAARRMDLRLRWRQAVRLSREGQRLPPCLPSFERPP